MRTVQEALNDFDEGELIDDYYDKHPIDLIDCDDDMDVVEAKSAAFAVMKYYLQRLKTLPIKQGEDQGIFFVHRYIEDGVGSETSALVYLNELKSKGDQALPYAYDLIEQSEILGYWVAETDLTLYYLEDLLIDIMYEASEYGIEQEDLQAEKNELVQASKSPLISEKLDWEKFKQDFADEMGFQLDKQSAEESKLERKVIEAVSAYNEYSRKKELCKVMDLLQLG